MKKSNIFAATYILIGGRIRLYATGFFYVRLQNIYGSVPPCNSVMGLLPIRCKSTGKAEPFLFSATINNFICNDLHRKN
jgi:hypothetical protein